jgi:glyoxylase I family protein
VLDGFSNICYQLTEIKTPEIGKRMKVERFHHVAFRCKDAKQTADFYKRVLNMELLGAIAEDKVPSTKAPDPYMHIFLDAGAGNILAFFELPNSPPMGRDENTPVWTQHIAFEVKDMEALNEARRAPGRRAGGDRPDRPQHLPVDLFLRSLGPPAGGRLLVGHAGQAEADEGQLPGDAGGMVRTRKPPKHNAWLHEKEFGAPDCPRHPGSGLPQREVSRLPVHNPEARLVARGRTHAQNLQLPGVSPTPLARAADRPSVKRHPVVVIGAGADRPLPPGSILPGAASRPSCSTTTTPFRIGSRAVCYAKRPLEFLDRLGCADPLVAKGISWKVGKVFFRDKLSYQFDLLPESDHKMPAMINLQQYYLEER